MLTRSQELFQKACQITPGGVHSPVRNLNHVNASPVFFSYGEGAHLFDVDGKSYIDFCLSFGPHLLGHCPDSVTRVLKDQVTKATSFGACHPKEVELCEHILKAYPFLDKVRLVNSGTEALMTAIRIARATTGKSKIIKFEGCYHGHSDGLLVQAGSGVSELKESSSLGVGASQWSDTLLCEFGNLDSLKAIFKTEPQIAAVVLEPIPANSGLWIPSRDYLHTVIELAREHNALVLFDEVISGFRVGPSGAAGLYDLQPDLVCLGKIIGGGLPLAAVAGRQTCMDQLAPLGGVYQAGTLSGNPLATAAGCAVLQEVEKAPPYERLEYLTTSFVDELEQILEAHYPARIERKSSIFWISLGEKPKTFPPSISQKQKESYAELFQKALAHGVYLPPSPYEVAFLSTAHTENVLTHALDIFRKCVK